MESVAAELVAWWPEIELGRGIVPTTMQRCTRFRLVDGWLERIGSTLETFDRRQVALPPSAALLGATDDLAVAVAASAAGDLLVDGAHRYRLSIAAADSVTFLPSGELLVTAPVMARSSRGRRHRAHRVLLVDADAGEVLDEAALEVEDAGIAAVLHPVDGSVVLEGGVGQDGSRVFAAWADRGSIQVVQLLEDVVVAGFDPSGEALLLTPHPSSDGNARAVRWPTMEAIGSFGPDQHGLGHLDYRGFHLRDDRVLLSIVEGDPLVCTAELEPVCRLRLGGHGLPRDATFEPRMCLGDDVFAAEMWAGGSSSATVWRVPRP